MRGDARVATNDATRGCGAGRCILRRVSQPIVVPKLAVRWRGAIGACLLAPAVTAAVLSVPIVRPGSALDLGFDVLGWIAFVCGAGLRVWATLFIGGRKGETVVTDGPYSLCRHPLYLGSILLFVSGACFLKSPLAAVAVAMLGTAYCALTIPAEEEYLAATLGAPVPGVQPARQSDLAVVAHVRDSAPRHHRPARPLRRGRAGLALGLAAAGRQRPERGARRGVVAPALHRALAARRGRSASYRNDDRDQSVRSAVSGSTRIARRAGTALATAPAVTIAVMAASHATGSKGVTP